MEDEPDTCVRCSTETDGDQCEYCGHPICTDCAMEYEPHYCDMPQCEGPFEEEE